jgi:MFS family permease
MNTHPTGIPGGIWLLGFVSLLMDVSSEMIHSLLPLFMVTTLGLGVTFVGLIEGLGRATAMVVKVYSGALTDWWGRRKGLAVLGYGLGAVSKPLFAIAEGAGIVLGARMLDRVGKGIRGAPRDALIADLTPPAVRGAAYGLRQSLDAVGAFLGPLLAIGLMWLWSGDFRAVFWIAALPAGLAVALLIFGLREPRRLRIERPVFPLQRRQLLQLPSAYWQVVLVGTLFALARFSDAFLVLRVEQLGLGLVFAPLVFVVMNLAYAVTAYPAGRLADRVSHRQLLATGLLVLILADLVLAAAGDWTLAMLGVLLWGVHMGLTQALLATMIAQSAPAALRGTAFGLFNLVSGLTTLIASLMAGLIWDLIGAEFTFVAGAAFCFVALLALLRDIR